MTISIVIESAGAKLDCLTISARKLRKRVTAFNLAAMQANLRSGGRKTGVKSVPMISDQQNMSHGSFVTASDSPAILRLKMLEMKIAVAGPLPDEARLSAQNLIGALKRAIAERPSMTFADVVAKLKTCDELARDGIGEKADGMRMSMIKSAIADLRRLPPPVRSMADGFIP